MSIAVTINAVDAAKILREAMAERFKTEVSSVTILSWQQTIAAFSFDEEAKDTSPGWVETPAFKHYLHNDHSQL